MDPRAGDPGASGRRRRPGDEASASRSSSCLRGRPPGSRDDPTSRSNRRHRAALQRDEQLRSLRDCYDSLTSRERQVMALVVSGLLNKQVAGELDISEITVKMHRGRVMNKAGGLARGSGENGRAPELVAETDS